MTFVDTNIIIDIFGGTGAWYDWSAIALSDAVTTGAVIDPIVIAELSRGFDTADRVLDTIAAMNLTIEPLDAASGFLAGKRFQDFRRNRADGPAARVLPDFLIGAHAVMLDMPLLTRNPRLYRRYFPELSLITPETDHD